MTLRASLSRIPTARVRNLVLAPAPLVLLALAAGCDGDGPGERIPLDRAPESRVEVEALPPEVQAALDSGNAAYRARDFDRALEHFTEVTRLDPGLAAGWYGVSMTHGVLGNSRAADSAMMRAHELAPEVPLRHPAPSAPPNPHPRPSAEADSGSGS